MTFFHDSIIILVYYDSRIESKAQTMSIGHALFLGFIIFFVWLIISSNILKGIVWLWFVIASVAGTLTIIFATSNQSTLLSIMLIATVAITALLIIFRWIGGSL